MYRELLCRAAGLRDGRLELVLQLLAPLLHLLRALRVLGGWKFRGLGV